MTTPGCPRSTVSPKRAARLRVLAVWAFYHLDVRDKVRRALNRAPRQHIVADLPGTRVYFWSPGVRRRGRPDPGRWRGPAVVVASEGQSKTFVSWRARLLLAAPARRT